MAVVRTFSGYTLSSFGFGNAVNNNETFTVPAGGPTIQFLITDDDANLDGNQGANPIDGNQIG